LWVLIGRVLGSWVMRWSVFGQTCISLGEHGPMYMAHKLAAIGAAPLPPHKDHQLLVPQCVLIVAWVWCISAASHRRRHGSVVDSKQHGAQGVLTLNAEAAPRHDDGGHVSAMGMRTACGDSPFLFLLPLFLPIFLSHSPSSHSLSGTPLGGNTPPPALTHSYPRVPPGLHAFYVSDNEGHSLTPTPITAQLQ